MLCRWKQTLEEQAQELFATSARSETHQERLAELERRVGQLTREVSAAKKLSSILPLRSHKNGR